jgi:excisionase family DNA binding protein
MLTGTQKDLLAEAREGRPLTVLQAAALLGYHPMTVRKKIAAGQIPAVQLGGPSSAIRIPARELQEWIELGSGLSEADPGAA